MDELIRLYGNAHAWLRDLPLGTIEKNCVVAAATLAFFYVLVWACERAGGTRTDNYRSKDFAFDVAFWFYYRSGLNWILFMAAFFTMLDGELRFLDVGLVKDQPYLVQLVVFLLVSDCCVYWAHRAMHKFRFLWAFHTTHHAPERMTFATSARFHPVEIFVQYVWYYALIRLMGANPLAWLPVLFIMELNLEAQHSRIPWKLGPFYRVIVTPSYHAYHHSTNPAHFDRNFCSGVFSFWDYLFGTAVPDGSPLPARLGLPDVRMPTLWSTLATPFRIALTGSASREDTLDGSSRLPG